MPVPNVKWLEGFSDTLDAAPAVDKGGGQVGLPITGHSFQAGQIVTIAGTVNYNAAYEIISKTANEIVITTAYVAETFAGTETVVFGRQVIEKADFRALEQAILTQGQVPMQPQLVFAGDAVVQIEATVDCPVATALSGLPNPLNSAVQLSGGLTDGGIRTNTSPVSMNFGIPGNFWGLEMLSQWYAVYAIAGDADTTLTLKGMPVCRVKSQAGQVIKTGTLVTPATGQNYGFTGNELAGGAILFLTGSSRGLIRTISANGVDTDTTITYTGTALSVAAGDWFYILPNTNFRFIDGIYNNIAGSIEAFDRAGDRIAFRYGIGLAAPSAGPTEEVRCGPPWAISLGVYGDAGTTIGHPDAGSSALIPLAGTFAETPIKFCKYRGTGAGVIAIYYKVPQGCGY